MVIWYFIFLIFLPNQFYGLKTKYINYKEEDEIAFIDLNNQNRNDFLNLETLEEIENIIDNININKIHGLIITHTEEENYFISGRNKNYFKNFTKEEFEEILRKKNKLFLKIESIPILVILVLNLNFHYIVILEYVLKKQFLVSVKSIVVSIQDLK